MVETISHEIETSGQGDTRDLTPLLERALGRSAIRSGLATVAVVGSTAGITTIEFEPGAIADLNAVWERLAPRHGRYAHHLRWGDDNGSSHVRAAMLGPSVSIPFTDGRPLLGTWQQVVLVEFDTRARRRQVIIQLLG